MKNTYKQSNKSFDHRRNTTIQLDDTENNETKTIKKFDITSRFKSAGRQRPKIRNTSLERQYGFGILGVSKIQDTNIRSVVGQNTKDHDSLETDIHKMLRYGIPETLFTNQQKQNDDLHKYNQALKKIDKTIDQGEAARKQIF